jgi:hypothetical protein
MRFIGPVAHITIAPRARSVCVCLCIRFLRNAGAVKAKNNRVAPCAPVMSHFHSHKGAALLGPARRMCVCNIIDRILSWIAYTFLLSEHIQAPFYYC